MNQDIIIENLTRENEKMKLMMNNLDMGIIRVDREQNILLINRTIEDWYNRPASEILGKKCYSLFTKGNSPCTDCPGVVSMNEGVPQSAVISMNRDGGDEFMVRNRTFPCFDDQGQTIGFVCLMEDITKYWELELKQKEEEEILCQYKHIVSSSTDMIAFVDRQYRYMIVNEAYSRAFHLTPEDFIGKRVSVFGEEHFAHVIKPLIDRCLSGKVIKEENWFDSPAFGRQFVEAIHYPYINNNEVMGCVVNIRDITAQKKAQDELIRSEKKYRTHFLQFPLPISVWKHVGEDFLLADFNLAAQEITDEKIEDIMGISAKELYAQEEAKHMLQTLETCFAEHRTIHKEFEYLFLSNNKKAWLNGTWVYIEPDTVVLHIEDITERKKAERERLLYERQILYGQKLESLGTLAGGIAHDFNNILMGVIGYAEISLMELPAESTVRNYLTSIVSASMRANELIKQMLSYSGNGHFRLEPIDINSMIEGMTHLLKSSISHNAILRFNFSENIPAIRADMNQLGQVLVNLITNASEALEEKSGIITISTGFMDITREYSREIFVNKDVASGHYSFIEVSDTGRGMDRETQLKIFDPFFSTKFTGRGLGLAATLGIIKSHKGAIKVYSESGKGTTFKVLFPCSDVQRNESFDNEKNNRSQQGKGITILVVDDEKTICILARKGLESHGFRVLTAEDSRQGLEIFRENKDNISLVILDMTMPYMSGEEVFREIRKIKPDTQVILSSGYNREEATKSFAGKGLAGFIQKPYLSSQLLEIVQSALNPPLSEDDFLDKVR